MTRRQRSRRQKQSQGGPTPLAQSDFSSIRNSLPALTPLSQDQLETIHHSSLKLLQEIGMEVTSAEARNLYKEAGAEVDEAQELVVMKFVFGDGIVPLSFTNTFLHHSPQSDNYLCACARSIVDVNGGSIVCVHCISCIFCRPPGSH